MTLAELVTGSGPSEDYGRTPPQDLAAEQSVLGGMLLSKDAVADVIEVLRGNDFYRPAHETIYEAILDLYGRGEPADAVTVSAELTKRGELGQIGGPAYLHTLISSVPTAANAGYYARIVRERAVLRRLVTAGTRIVQLGYATDGGDVDEIVNAAQAEVYAVTVSAELTKRGELGQIGGPAYLHTLISSVPTAGRAAMTIICPAWNPFVSRSRSANPVGIPVSPSPRWLEASISSIAPSMISASGR